jgi:hypothetical protein
LSFHTRGSCKCNACPESPTTFSLEAWRWLLTLFELAPD